MKQKNGLRMKTEMNMEDKRFSFFADPQKNNEKECHHTFAHLATYISTKPTKKGNQKSKSSNPHFFINLKIIAFSQ